MFCIQTFRTLFVHVINIKGGQTRGVMSQRHVAGGGQWGLRYCGVRQFFLRYFGNYNFELRYCSILRACGMRFFLTFWTILKIIFSVFQCLFQIPVDKGLVIFLLIISQHANGCYLFCLNRKLQIPNRYFRVICSELDIKSSGFGMTLNFDPAYWSVAIMGCLPNSFYGIAVFRSPISPSCSDKKLV